MQSLTLSRALENEYVQTDSGNQIPESVKIIWDPNKSVEDQKIVIGKNVQIGENCVIYAGVIIGDDTSIGHMVVLGHDVIIGSNTKLANFVSIGRGSLVGDDATIYNGIEIGTNSIVEHNTIVTRNMPANVIISGIPGYVIDENLAA